MLLETGMHVEIYFKSQHQSQTLPEYRHCTEAWLYYQWKRLCDNFPGTNAVLCRVELRLTLISAELLRQWVLSARAADKRFCGLRVKTMMSSSSCVQRRTGRLRRVLKAPAPTATSTWMVVAAKAEEYWLVRDSVCSLMNTLPMRLAGCFWCFTDLLQN